jgi:hypothetical protein
VLFMDMIAEIRRRHLVSKESISSIARDLQLSRPTVRKHCRTQSEPIYRRDKQPTPMLGAFQETLETWLRTERLLPKAQRRTARRLFEGLQAEGYRGAYDSVQRFVQRWKAAKSGPALTQAFVPLAFAPGEVCQFDWSHEHVELPGCPRWSCIPMPGPITTSIIPASSCMRSPGTARPVAWFRSSEPIRRRGKTPWRGFQRFSVAIC